MYGLRLVAEVESYDTGLRRWLGVSGRHYLDNPPPQAFFALVVREAVPGLVGFVGAGPRLGCCLLGRPSAPALPQDGSMADVTRFVLVDRFPGAASWLLRRAFDVAAARGIRDVIAYHDRTRHTGCIYRKAGMRKDRASEPKGEVGWSSRPGRTALPATPKRRWHINVVGRAPTTPFVFDVVAEQVDHRFPDT